MQISVEFDRSWEETHEIHLFSKFSLEISALIFPFKINQVSRTNKKVLIF